jgi:cation transport regulator
MALAAGLRADMPYPTNLDLPPGVRGHLPPHAQDIYRAVFNNAYAAHMDDPRREEASHRIAWAAVKRRYVKVGHSWIAQTAGTEPPRSRICP